MLGLSSKAVVTDKSVTAFNWTTMERFLAIKTDLITFNFREKSHWSQAARRGKTHILPYRIPTQVGWSRRLRRSGERWSRNSAKKLGVTFGRCPAWRSQVTTKVYLATVYLKHRSLQNRKVKYRGWRLPSAGKLKIVGKVRKNQLVI